MQNLLKRHVSWQFPGLILLASFIPGVWPEFAWGMRGAVLFAWILSLPLVVRTPPIGPAWILATLVMFFYGLIPLGIEQLTLSGISTSFLFVQGQTLIGNYGFYFSGNKAELWIWRFVFLLLCASHFQTVWVWGAEYRTWAYTKDVVFRLYLFVVSVILLSLRLLNSPHLTTAHDLLLPTIIFSFSYAFLMWLKFGKDSRNDLIFAATCLFLGISIFDGKYLFFYFIGLSPQLFVFLKIKRALILSISVISLVLIGTIFIHMNNGVKTVTDSSEFQTVKDLVVSKVIARQYITLRCYSGALAAQQTSNEQLNGPLFFVAALVPRALWPNKPSFSQGDKYSERYCGDNCCGEMVASITTLGEPWLHGGAPMTLVAMGGIALLLMIVGMCIARGPLPFAAMGLALTPWLLDFDLHFSLWLALVVRGIIVMAPLATWLYWRQIDSHRPCV